MMPRTDMEHLPWSIRQELHRVTAMLFEAFAETIKGRLSEQYRTGRIVDGFRAPAGVRKPDMYDPRWLVEGL